MSERSTELAIRLLPEIRAHCRAGTEPLDDVVAKIMAQRGENDADLLAEVRLEVRRLLGSASTPDLVEETSIESFPASDPPSWAGGRPVDRIAEDD